jgi:hypothetical protein
MTPTQRILRWTLPALPIAALTIATPLVNRVEPRVDGIPFFLAWIALWVLATPACLWGVGRIEKRW